MQAIVMYDLMVHIMFCTRYVVPIDPLSMKS